MKLTGTPISISVLGIVANTLLKINKQVEVNEMKMSRRQGLFRQPTTLVKPVVALKRIQEYWEYLLSLDLQIKPFGAISE